MIHWLFAALLVSTSFPPVAWAAAPQLPSRNASSALRPFGIPSAQWTPALTRFLLVHLPQAASLPPGSVAFSALSRLQQRLAADWQASEHKPSAGILAPLAAALNDEKVAPETLDWALTAHAQGQFHPVLERAVLRARASVEQRILELSRQIRQEQLATRRLDRALRELETIQRDYLAYLSYSSSESSASETPGILTQSIAAGRESLALSRRRRVSAAGRSLRQALEESGDKGEAPPLVSAGNTGASGLNASGVPAGPGRTAPGSSHRTRAKRAQGSFPSAPRAPPQGIEPLSLGLGPASGERPSWAQGVFLARPVEKPLAWDALGVTVHRLSNGMTVYLSPNPGEPRVYYEIAVRAGSRHDPLEATGMAHYLEHMQFKGTRRLGTLDYAREKHHLDRIEALYDQLFETSEPEQRSRIYASIDAESQAAAAYAVPNEFDKLFSASGFTEINAHTSYDETVYEGSFPSNRAEVWARTEADRLAEPVYRIFLPELEAVYEEYNRSRDNPDSALFYASLGALFKGHPYGRDIIGHGEHLKNPSLSRMRRFFSERYRPNNMAIILSGDFERAEMLARLERSFGKLQPAAVPAPPSGVVRGPRGVEPTELRHQAEEKVQTGWLLPGHNHPDEDSLILMDMLMDNRWTGILNLSVNKAQRVKESGSFPGILNEAGGWFVWAAPKEGQTLEQAEQVLLEAVERLKAGDFTEEDLKAVIADFEVREKRRLEKNDDRVGLIRQAFISGQEWEDAARRLERLKRVTKADILRVANRYLGQDRVVVYRRKGTPKIEKVSKPAFTPLSIDAAKESPFFGELLSLPARPLSPRFLRPGRDYTALDRAWGRLYATRNPVNDLFTLEFRFERGNAHEARLTLALKLLELSGAQDMGIDEFQQQLYRLGSTMETRCENRECVMRLRGLEKNLKETLRLALLRFSRPKVAAGAFARMIEVERGDRQDRKLDVEEINDALEGLAQRGQQSPVLKELTPSRLDALTEGELKDVLGSVFDYRRSVLYTGGRKASEVAKLLSAAQSRRRYRPAPAGPSAKLLVPSRPRVVFVHREGMKQALIGAYAADGGYVPGSRLDYRLYNTLMGGGMAGVYFQEVREARALAYSAKGGYGQAQRKGDDNSLWSWAGTQADKALQTAELLRELMLRPPLTPARFASARREVEQYYRTVVPLLEAIPQSVRAWELLGLMRDPRTAAFDRLPSYRPEELEAFTSRFRDKALTFYILADRGGVDIEGLRKLGDFEERTVDELFPF